MENTSQTGKTRWHRLLGRLFEELLVPVGVSVYTEFPVMSQSPEADILLLRKARGEWTPDQLARLPDGIRQSGEKHILVEFKYTESVGESAFRQIMGYETFYISSRKLTNHDVRSFIISAKIPSDKTLDEFGYRRTEKNGVYRSGNALLKKIAILSLNELSNAPHNAFVKCFASRKAQKKSAFDALRHQGLEAFHVRFQWFMEGLWHYWFTVKGINMKPTELTPEQVTEFGRIWTETILASLPIEEVLARYKPEEILSAFTPEEILSRYKPEEILSAFTPEEIDAYLRKIRKKSKKKA